MSRALLSNSLLRKPGNATIIRVHLGTTCGVESFDGQALNVSSNLEWIVGGKGMKPNRDSIPLCQYGVKRPIGFEWSPQFGGLQPRKRPRTRSRAPFLTDSGNHPSAVCVVGNEGSDRRPAGGEEHL